MQTQKSRTIKEINQVFIKGSATIFCLVIHSPSPAKQPSEFRWTERKEGPSQEEPLKQKENNCTCNKLRFYYFLLKNKFSHFSGWTSRAGDLVWNSRAISRGSCIESQPRVWITNLSLCLFFLPPKHVLVTLRSSASSRYQWMRANQSRDKPGVKTNQTRGTDKRLHLDTR